MYKRMIIIFSLLLVVIFGLAAFGAYEFQKLNHPYVGINPEKLPRIITDEILEKHNSERETTYGFSGKDLSTKDMSQVSLSVISNISFDQSTKWPAKDKLPKGFDPSLIIENGKNPGLNIREIHKMGITGKGISVAIIDKPIAPTHDEFKGRIRYIKVGKNQASPHFHGLACASILAGKTTGVAPDANLYYFSFPDTNDKFQHYTEAVNKIIEINKSLSQNEKIRIVSISDGFSKESGSQWDNWQETLEKAKSQGIAIVYSNLLEHKKFTWGGAYPTTDRDTPLNYNLSNYLKGRNIDKSYIIVPGDFITTASSNGNDQYVYLGEGGFSWSIPYVTGLITLAWQINPNLSFDDIISKLVATKTVTSTGQYIIDPKAFINLIR